jgi:hypothetical protein
VSGDYLWDRSGPPDFEVARLERQLRPLRQDTPPPPLRLPVAASHGPRPFAFLMALAATAAIVVALVSLAWRVPLPNVPGLAVTRLQGTPVVGSHPVEDRGQLGVGRWLETDSTARASIDVADIGRVDVEPDTRLGLLSTKPGDYRLHLARGTMHALIWAPPGQFFVETPSSTAIDLGCSYTLHVNDEGVGIVRVTSGWVGFEWRGRESFIPVGAMCITRPGLGPGTPHFDDEQTSDAFRAALETIDLGRGSPATQTAAVDRIIGEARERDVVTLWHLLSRAAPADRDRVFDRLATFVPPPDGVTREGIRAGRREMLDLWWDKLGFGAASWWRTWKQQWRDDPSRR